MLGTELVDKVLIERLSIDLAYAVTGERIRHTFDDAAYVELATSPVRDRLVRIEE